MNSAHGFRGNKYYTHSTRYRVVIVAMLLEGGVGQKGRGNAGKLLGKQLNCQNLGRGQTIQDNFVVKSYETFKKHKHKHKHEKKNTVTAS